MLCHVRGPCSCLSKSRLCYVMSEAHVHVWLRVVNAMSCQRSMYILPYHNELLINKNNIACYNKVYLNEPVTIAYTIECTCMDNFVYKSIIG